MGRLLAYWEQGELAYQRSSVDELGTGLYHFPEELIRFPGTNTHSLNSKEFDNLIHSFLEQNVSSKTCHINHCLDHFLLAARNTSKIGGCSVSTDIEKVESFFIVTCYIILHGDSWANYSFVSVTHLLSRSHRFFFSTPKK